MLRCETVNTKYSGSLKVYIQGDIKDRAGKVVFLTVHDVGFNHKSFLPFVNCTPMTEVKKKSIWVNVCLPGQDDNDDLLPEGYEFPALDGIAHDLYYVLDRFNVNTVIGMGEGAGSNILCRFGLYFPNRCLGLVLIDCTSSTAGVEEYIKYTMFNWKEGSTKLVDKLMKFLTYHKYGSGGRSESWKENMQAQNLAKYLDVFLKRSDISPLVAKDLKVEAVLINGGMASNIQSTYTVNRLNPQTTTIVILDGVFDVLREAPKNLTRALILFCKGCGVLLGVPMLGLENEFKRVKERQAANKAQLAIASKILNNERTETHKSEGRPPALKVRTLNRIVEVSDSADAMEQCGIPNMNDFKKESSEETGGCSLYSVD